ncbi:hypothetical protein [Mesorhizobium sp. M0199]|uniref:hypothetical protein n=1 Tax=unclassified Mesorhizobium TaxID=325217 RepID=UPI003338A7B5
MPIFCFCSSRPCGASANIQQNLDPLSAVGMRCLIGGLLVLPLIFREGRMIMALSIALQQIGYLDTSVTSCAQTYRQSPVALLESAGVLGPDGHRHGRGVGDA